MKNQKRNQKTNEITGKDLKRELFRGNKRNFVLAFIAMLLFAGVNLYLQWLVQQLMDLLAGEADVQRLSRLAWMAVGMLVVLLFAMLLNYISKPHFITKGMRQYADFALDRIGKKSISAFAGESSAVYISALSNDLNTIETKYMQNIFDLWNNIAVFVGAVVMMLFYSPILTLVAFILTSLPIVASVLIGNKLEALEKQVSDKNSGFIATVKDCISGFSVVKSFKAEERIIGLVKGSNRELAETKCRRRKKTAAIDLISNIAGIVAQLGVFFVGAYMAFAGVGVSAGTVLAFTMLMNFVIAPIMTVPGLLAERKAALGLMDKLAAALSENVSEEGEDIPRKLEDAIELKDVSFGYNEGEDVLKNISQRFEAGKSYAIVGGSGCGKSTLLNLLMSGNGGYQGEICYDGKELREISTGSLYDVVSLIQQNVFVFNHSILDNITMFKEFSETEVADAVEKSGLSQLLSEKGRDYLCGENGSALSGGEKQRVSIARSLLRKTPVLLVDEATAALDKQTAQHVSESILDLKGLTRIVVTHSLEEDLLKKYDEILVLKNGTIFEKGQFEELMDRKGYFYSLYSVQ